MLATSHVTSSWPSVMVVGELWLVTLNGPAEVVTETLVVSVAQPPPLGLLSRGDA